MLSKELQDQLTRFNDKYKTTFDLEGTMDAARRFASLDAYMLTQKPQKMKTAETYFGIMKQVLIESLNEQTRINRYNRYNLDGFNLVRFINDFEDLMAGYNAESKTPRTDRVKYENIKPESLIASAKNAIKSYNQPIYTAWANRILNDGDKFSYKTLKIETTNATARIAQSTEQDKYEMGDLANVVYAKEAMEQVRASRTGWWKFWHPINNYRENKYLESLRTQVAAYAADPKYPVTAILEHGSRNILEKAYEDPAFANAAEENEAKIIEQVQQMHEERRAISHVYEDVEKMLDSNFKDDLIKDMMELLPKDVGFPFNLKKSALFGAIDGFVEAVQRANKSFDTYLATGQKAENLMDDIVESVYGEVYKVVEQKFGYVFKTDACIGAQVITDVLLLKISPVGLRPDLKLDKFARGHLTNDPLKIANIINREIIPGDVEYIKNTYKELLKAREEKEIAAGVVPSWKQDDFTKTLVEDLAKKLPNPETLTHENKNVKEMTDEMSRAYGLQGLGKRIDGFNKEFQLQLTNGVDRQQATTEYMKKLVWEAKNLTDNMGYNELVSRYTSVQIVMDYLMQNCSPIQERENLQEFMEGGFLSNMELLKEIYTYADENQEAIDAAVDAYNQLKDKETVIIADINDVSVNAPIVNPIESQAPVVQPPIPGGNN